MGGIRSYQSSTGQPLGDTLPYHLLKQTTEDLAKARLPPPQLADGAVIRHPVKQIQPQIPPQGYIRLDPLLDLTLGRYSVQKAHQQIFHQHHRVDGRPPIPPAVQVSRFLIDKAKIQYRIQFPQKMALWYQIFYRHHMELQLHLPTSVCPYFTIVLFPRGSFVNSSTVSFIPRNTVDVQQK